MRAAAVALALVALAAAAAPPALAQAEDLKAIDAALEALYVPEPEDIEGVLARLQSIKARRQQDPRVEAGLALAYAALAERSGLDEDLVKKALTSGNRAANMNPNIAVTRRAQGLASLVAARAERRKSERQPLIATAIKCFDVAAQKKSDDRWLDLLNRARASLAARAYDDALDSVTEAEGLLPAERPERRFLAVARARAHGGRGEVADAVTTLGGTGVLPTATAGIELAFLLPGATTVTSDLERRAGEAAGPAVAAEVEAARKQGREAPFETAVRLGSALLAAGRADEALEEAQRGLALKADYLPALVLRARGLLALTPPKGEPAKAIALPLAERFPDCAEAHALVAGALAALGEDAGAREAAGRALALDPACAPAQAILAHLSGGGPAEAVEGEKPLPPELEPAMRKLTSGTPFERVAAAETLMADPAGVERVLRHAEREREMFVVGEIANLFAARGTQVAVATLKRLLHTLPPTEVVARGRVLRALGRLRDPSALPEILKASMAGEGYFGSSGHGAVVTLMGELDEGGSIRFQRQLVESHDELERALAPVLAEHLTGEKMALVEEERARRDRKLAWVRGVLLALMAFLAFWRFREYVRLRRLQALAHAAAEHRKSGTWDTLKH